MAACTLHRLGWNQPAADHTRAPCAGRRHRRRHERQRSHAAHVGDDRRLRHLVQKHLICDGASTEPPCAPSRTDDRSRGTHGGAGHRQLRPRRRAERDRGQPRNVVPTDCRRGPAGGGGTRRLRHRSHGYVASICRRRAAPGVGRRPIAKADLPPQPSRTGRPLSDLRQHRRRRCQRDASTDRPRPAIRSDRLRLRWRTRVSTTGIARFSTHWPPNARSRSIAARLYEAALRRQAGLVLLADASTILAGAGDDLDEALQQFVNLMSPALADVASIHLLESPTVSRLAASAFVESEQLAETRRVSAFGADLNASHGLGRVATNR